MPFSEVNDNFCPTINSEDLSPFPLPGQEAERLWQADSALRYGPSAKIYSSMSPAVIRDHEFSHGRTLLKSVAQILEFVLVYSAANVVIDALRVASAGVVPSNCVARFASSLMPSSIRSSGMDEKPRRK
jgi:hypothetical protein